MTVKAIGYTMGPQGRASVLILKQVGLCPEGLLYLFLLVSWLEGSLSGHCEVDIRALGRLGPARSQESCFFSGPRLQKKHLQQEKECLMSKLVEAEMDGAAAAKQVMALKDTIGKLKTEKQMTCTDINTLTRQKELLLQKLSTFEETNRTLRDLLREQHCKEVSI